jgi:phage tail-like protein
MAQNALQDVLVTFHFALDVSGAVQGTFAEVSGLGSENEVVENKVSMGAGAKDVIKKIPGRLKYNDVTLKRGITDNMDMWNWRKMIEKGDVVSARKNATITMYDTLGKAIARWNLTNAWPSKISGPSIKADSSEMGVEELTITFEDYEREM